MEKILIDKAHLSIVFLLRCIPCVVLLFCLLSCSRTTPTAEEITSVKKDMASEDSKAAKTKHSLDCQKICDPKNPDYRCLFTGTMGNGRDAQLTALAQRLRYPQPLTVSHRELLQIFGLENSGYDSARGATTIDNGLLKNGGNPSEISTKTTSNLSVSLSVPSEVNYAFQNTDSGFTLTSSATGDFVLHINDAVLQRQYGGTVSSVVVAPPITIITTDNGCIYYDSSPQLANGEIVSAFTRSLARRLAAERAAGATQERIARVSTAYGNATLLASEPCSVDQCPKCENENEVSCRTSLGDTCMNVIECAQYGRACGQ